MRIPIETYPGQYYDEETGFHYNYQRYYDPRTGRYLRADPSHYPQPPGSLPYLLPFLASLPQELNLYSYVLGNPIRSVDVKGLVTCEDEMEKCVDDCLEDNYGAIFDHMKELSIIGAFSTITSLAAATGFDVLGRGSRIASQSAMNEAADIIASPAKTHGEFGLLKREVTASRSLVRSGAWAKAARYSGLLASVSQAVLVGSSAFVLTAYVYCYFGCL